MTHKIIDAQKMLQIKKNYFVINEPETFKKDLCIHFVMSTYETKNICKMSQLYAGLSDLADTNSPNQIVMPIPNNNSAFTMSTKPHSKQPNPNTKPKYILTLAQKILSPLSRPSELQGISADLINFVRKTSFEFRQLNFPKWFSDQDKKKFVHLNFVLRDTLEMDPFWQAIPYTTLNLLSCSSSCITCLLSDIFQAVYSNYKTEILIISSKNGMKGVKHAEEIKMRL